MSKKVFPPLLFIGLFGLWAEAQVRFGIRGGLNDIKADADPLTIIDEIGDELFQVDLDETGLGLLGGLVVQARFNNFLLQPELLLSSSKYHYEVTDPANPDSAAVPADEKYLYFDVPLLIGFKLGPLRLQAGPEAHIYVNSISDLVDLDYYQENIDNFTFGWAGNIGLDIWNIMLDLRYEGNLQRFGNSFVVGGQEFKFDDRPDRWVFSLGYLF